MNCIKMSDSEVLLFKNLHQSLVTTIFLHGWGTGKDPHKVTVAELLVWTFEKTKEPEPLDLTS